MKRCDRPAIYCTANNGFRVCRDHYDEANDPAVVWIDMRAEGPGPFGPCDKPIETPAQFWARHGSTRTNALDNPKRPTRTHSHLSDRSEG